MVHLITKADVIAAPRRAFPGSTVIIATIMMIIIKTKIAGLKIIISQKNQKITMTFNKTSFTKAVINSNQLS